MTTVLLKGEELEVARADLSKSEERVMDLMRTIAELEAKVADLKTQLSGRLD